MNRRSTLQAVGWLLGWIALLWVVAVVYRASSPDYNPPGQCTGIGFGCVPTPRDGISIAMVIVGVPITVSALIIGLPWILVWRRRWPAWVVGSSAFACGTVVALLALTLTGVLNG